ncbi:MAG: DnaJ C-terminal domain-containing protein [Bdellovibrionales bacterium]
MRDPYQTLGVTKTAGADEIKSAYRKLAKKLHPDVNPGRKDIEQKFKEVTAAYDLLSDKDKRARYDRGEIDAMGNERAYSGGDGNPYAGSGGWRGYSQAGSNEGFSQFSGIDDIFSEFLGGTANRRGGKAGPPPRGADVTYSLAIPFIEACLGGKRRVTLTSGKTIEVTIPPGINEGHKLRLRGQGMGGMGMGTGDAIIEMHIEPHPYFVRKNKDIHLEVPVSLPEAVLGADVRVPTLDGHVTVKVPKGANTGSTLRLKGKGVPVQGGGAGDMFVKLKIAMPDQPTPDLAEFIEKWAKKNPYDPRKGLGWT